MVAGPPFSAWPPVAPARRRRTNEPGRCLAHDPASAADLGTRVNIGCHTFRATGIAAYLEAGGTLENAQAMAAHENPRTTKLYDRTGDENTLDEVENDSDLGAIPCEGVEHGQTTKHTFVQRDRFSFPYEGRVRH
jgi:hypothetical protein